MYPYDCTRTMYIIMCLVFLRLSGIQLGRFPFFFLTFFYQGSMLSTCIYFHVCISVVQVRVYIVLYMVVLWMSMYAWTEVLSNLRIHTLDSQHRGIYNDRMNSYCDVHTVRLCHQHMTVPCLCCRSVTLHNRSKVVVHYQWKAFSSEEEEEAHKQLLVTGKLNVHLPLNITQLAISHVSYECVSHLVFLQSVRPPR